MSVTQALTALLPMRHESERVPGKNYRAFSGQPLYHHILRALLACPDVAKIVIDTDSLTIAAGIRKHFPDVVLLDRPEHLRGGHVPMNEILLHDVSQVSSAYYLQTHATNPLLRSQTISRAIREFFAATPAHDSLFSVTRVQKRFWDGNGQAINHDPAVLLRTQDLPPIYEENSCLYIFTPRLLETYRTRIGSRPLMFEIDRIEAFDIDDETDFRVAEILAGREL